MVVSECAIVAALAMVAWHVVVSPPAPQPSLLRAASPTAQARRPATSGPVIVAGDQRASSNAALPGLNLNSSFWRARLADLNRGENSFEQLEWRVVNAAVAATRRYVESVVVPALARVDRAAR